MINTNRVDSTVLLFLRPTNGMYLAPKVVRLQGKSTVEEIGIAPHDMPNFFVEALTVADGKLHNEVREIAVPPESRIVDVAIEPLQTTYKPGQKAKVKVKLTGPDGKPFLGSSVLTVYDKAVEYIAGGSNVPDIKEFFWNWKRHHQPQTESSLSRWFSNLLKPNEVGMEELGGSGGFDETVARGGLRFGAMNMRMRGLWEGWVEWAAESSLPRSQTWLWPHPWQRRLHRWAQRRLRTK